MNRSARVGSIESLTALRLALIRFTEDCHDGLTSLQLESRRGAEWVEVDRANYWPAQARKASDDHKSAQVNLERCELAVRPEDRRSCYEEKKAVERAKQRIRLCEEKVRVVRNMAQKVNQETRDFHGDLSRLENYVDSDLPRAIAALEKMIASLERYAQSTGLDQPPKSPAPDSAPSPTSDPTSPNE